MERSDRVIVAGAGPTGLLLAGELARRDVPCLLIDALDAPRDWDRATIVHPRSMEIFEALGLAERLLDRGVRIHTALIRSGGEPLGELELEVPGSRYGFDTGLSEEVTESVLAQSLEAHGVSVTRSTSLVGLDARPDGVTATIERDGERRELGASWLIGCDGLHSAVRELAGIGFPGADLATRWAVFDATIDGWEEGYGVQVAHLDTPPVILTPLPGRRWRVYVRPTSDDSDLVSEALEVVRRYAPGVSFTGIENPVRFRCHSRVANHFRSGRVLLAGDAAHACSPSEGHGMNTGLQDAFNLGWKLALVWRGVAGAALLDTYEAERRPVAIRVAESGDATEAAQALSATAERAARDAEIRRTLADPGSAHHEAVAVAEIDRSYAGSAIVLGDASERLAPGARLPETIPVDSGGGRARALHELTHRPGHTLLVLGGPRAAADEVAELVGSLESIHAGSPIVDGVVGLATSADGAAIGRIDESVAEQLGIDGATIIAVRPDRYIGFRHDGSDPRALDAYIAALTA